MEIRTLDALISMKDVGAILRFLPALQALRPEEVVKRYAGELICQDPLTFTG